MKWLLAGVAGLAVLVSAVWFGWAQVTERAVTGWLDAREAEGWAVTRGEVSVTGFPSTFVTEFDTLTLADPATGLVWSAPSFTVRQDAWDLTRIEAIWPETHTLASPFERVTITAGDMGSVLDVQPATHLALDASQTRLRDVHIASTLGWETRLAQGRIDMVRQPDTAATYSIVFEATDLTPPADLARLIDPAGVLPGAIPVVLSDAVITFDKPWDLSALEVARPQPVRIALAEARAEWGDLMLRLSGAVDVDDQGRGTGEVTIRAQNWPAMLDMAERGGVLGNGARQSVETALGFLAGLTGRREDLDVTLRLSDGFMFLGPLPIGEGPRLRVR